MENRPDLPVPSIVVVGANGGIGRQTVDLALAADYHVTALLRNPANLPLTHPNLQIVKGDVFQPLTFAPYLAGKTAVISALGTTSKQPTTLYSEGNAILLQEMKKAGVERAFFISASAIVISPLQPLVVRLLTKYVLQKILRNMYADITVMEQLIKAGDACWTIVRPPRLTDKQATGHYRVAIDGHLKNGFAISRADVAHFMINNLDNKDTFNATVEIAY
jgi:putative NADH-flavin reductase